MCLPPPPPSVAVEERQAAACGCTPASGQTPGVPSMELPTPVQPDAAIPRFHASSEVQSTQARATLMVLIGEVGGGMGEMGDRS